MALGLAPIFLLEAGLRIAGIGDAPTDLHAGFGNVSALFEHNPDESVWRTSLAKEQFFVSQEFPDSKPKNEFRFFCLGGSTVQGRPYRPETSFGKWLELELNASDSSRQYRAINCGGISYASYRLRPVIMEAITHEPDLIILATGHNEFLEDRTYSSVKSRSGARIWLENQAKSLRTVMLLRKLVGGAPRVEPTEDDADQLSEGVEARLDDDAGYASYHRDEEWHDQVCSQYHDSVVEMLDMCKQADVPVVLVRLGANHRDCPPFKSEHRINLSVDDQQAWQRLFDEATAIDAKDPEAALKLYQQAMEIDDQYPLLHFRIARCYDQLKQLDAARSSYRTALSEDICPLRMVDRISADLLSIAENNSTMLVDAESVVAQSSPDQIPGYESYIDHVHPTIGVHQLIAQQIASVLRERKIVSGSELTAESRRRTYARHFDSLNVAYFSNGRRRIGWLEGWARRQRLADEVLPVDTRGYVAASIRYLDLHDYEQASDHMQMALAIDTKAAPEILNHSANLFAQGRIKDARWVLQQLQLGSLDESFGPGVDLAELMIAIEAGTPADIQSAKEKHAEQWASVFADGPPAWKRQMPDLLQRLNK